MSEGSTQTSNGVKRAIIILAVVIVFGGAYYFISPLFNVQEVDDALPETATQEREITSGFEDLPPEKQAEMLEVMTEVNAEEPKEMEDSNPEATGEVMSSASASFTVMGTVGHPASGTVRVVETPEETIVRYEDFETINGPRLHIYLAKDLGANDFIDLGPIRGTKGNINYTVPEGVDLSEYRYVMYWCVPFGVLFNYADLADG